MADSSEFDIARLREALKAHWQHHGASNHLNWSWFERDDGVWQVEVGPVYQEIFGSKDDGKMVWTGFQVNLSGFLAEPGVAVEEFGAVSYVLGQNETPIIGFRGKYRGVPFVMKLHLEPIPDSPVHEVIDTLRREVRLIQRETP